LGGVCEEEESLRWCKRRISGVTRHLHVFGLIPKRYILDLWRWREASLALFVTVSIHIHHPSQAGPDSTFLDNYIGGLGFFWLCTAEDLSSMLLDMTLGKRTLRLASSDPEDLPSTITRMLNGRSPHLSTPGVEYLYHV
jgi:hypothetical protein